LFYSKQLPWDYYCYFLLNRSANRFLQTTNILWPSTWATRRLKKGLFVTWQDGARLLKWVSVAEYKWVNEAVVRIPTVIKLGYVSGEEGFGDVTILWTIEFLIVKPSQEIEEDFNTHCKFLRILATETERNVEERGWCLLEIVYQLLFRRPEQEKENSGLSLSIQNSKRLPHRLKSQGLHS
jgi:hypothetical protein